MSQIPAAHRHPVHEALMFGLVILLSSTVGCGPGSCIAEGGIVAECKEGWTAAECADWDDIGVNGSDWIFRAGTCESNGFPFECADGSWVTSSGDC